MKKTIITLSIILGMTMTSFADGGLFNRGNNANTARIPATSTSTPKTPSEKTWLRLCCRLTAPTTMSLPRWAAASPSSWASAPPTWLPRSAERNKNGIRFA